MARPSKRNALLDAATRVVAEEGAARLTLDRVAKRAGVSKGGVLYHFPDRRSLLVALVECFVESFEAQVARDDDREWAKAYVSATLASARFTESAALIAVVAEDRTLLTPLACRMTAWMARLCSASNDPLATQRIFLTADAVWYSELFGLPAPTGEAREELRGRLLAELDTLIGDQR